MATTVKGRYFPQISQYNILNKQFHLRAQVIFIVSALYKGNVISAQFKTWCNLNVGALYRFEN